jgi:hypothetical protein
MALLGTITKQPREILDFDIDYTTVLAGRSDTLSTQTSEVTPSGLTLVSTTRTGNIVKVVISTGTDTQLYKVTVLVTTTAGLRYEDEVNVLVGEV